jgi:hypothetical protein
MRWCATADTRLRTGSSTQQLGMMRVLTGDLGMPTDVDAGELAAMFEVR